MAYLRRSAEEQLKLIEACRESGLTNAAWCRREGINLDTFYTWISRLSKRGMLEKAVTIPETIIREPVNPNIVKIEVATSASGLHGEAVSGMCATSDPSVTSGSNNSMSATRGAVMEVSLGQIRIKVTNQVNPQLLAQALQMIGGAMGC